MRRDRHRELPAPGHRAAGARFDRFGLITTWIDGNGQLVYFDDLRYTCGPGRRTGAGKG